MSLPILQSKLFLNFSFDNKFPNSKNPKLLKMSLLIPTSYIPSNISFSQQTIELSLSNSKKSHQQLFRDKIGCDLLLKFKSKLVSVHWWIIDQYIDIELKKAKIYYQGRQIPYAQVICSGKENLFESIISCLYGYTITLKRSQIMQAYAICKQLKLYELLNIFYFDIIQNFEEYQIFPLLKFATELQISNVIELCYDQLATQKYEPMRYNKSGLFICDMETFKTILKKHKQSKKAQLRSQKFGLSNHQIKRLVDEYCFINEVQDRQRQQIHNQVEDKEQCHQRTVIKRVLKKYSFPRSNKSNSKLNTRCSLTEIREKDYEKQNQFEPKKSQKSIKYVHWIDEESFEPQRQALNYMTPNKLCRLPGIQSQKSLSNLSTQYKSKVNSRWCKQNYRSASLIPQASVANTVQSIEQSLKLVRDEKTTLKQQANRMFKSMQRSVQNTRERTQRIEKMFSQLDEINAEIENSSSRLQQIQRTVKNIEFQNGKQEPNWKQKSYFQTSIALELTVSQQFGKR